MHRPDRAALRLPEVVRHAVAQGSIGKQRNGRRGERFGVAERDQGIRSEASCACQYGVDNIGTPQARA